MWNRFKKSYCPGSFWDHRKVKLAKRVKYTKMEYPEKHFKIIKDSLIFFKSTWIKIKIINKNNGMWNQ